MNESIPYVNEASFELAMQFEQRIADLPAAAGILMVSVAPRPVPGGKSRSFEVAVFTSRARDQRTMEAVLRSAFAQELSNGEVELTLKVFAGRRAIGGTPGIEAGSGLSATPS